MPPLPAADVPCSLKPLQRMTLALAIVLLVAGLAPQAQASGRTARHGSKAGGASPSADATRAGVGKVAVFAFDGDEKTNVRKHVVLALTNQGLQVETDLRPVHTTDELRDMGATLNLAAYIHGRIKDRPGDKAEATITIRSGVTGKPIATATITGYQGGLRFDVEEKLWRQVGKAIQRACKEATKPRRPIHAPTRIDASGPL